MLARHLVCVSGFMLWGAAMISLTSPVWGIAWLVYLAANP